MDGLINSVQHRILIPACTQWPHGCCQSEYPYNISLGIGTITQYNIPNTGIEGEKLLYQKKLSIVSYHNILCPKFGDLAFFRISYS